MKKLAHTLLLGIAALLCTAAASAASSWDNARSVSRDQLVTAMRAQQAKGYTVEAIGNSNRLLTGVFLELAERASAADPERHPLRVGHAEYFNALLEVSGVAAEAAPPHMRVPNEFRQDYLIDYRPENVIATIEHEPKPRRALNVKGGWPQAPGAPASYSYEDTSSKPHVEVTHTQVISYRILDFGNIIVCDEIRGITGRATSGALGAIFSVLGKAQALHSRYLVAPDGLLLSRTGAKKLFTVTKTVVIFPDGRLLTDIPDDRPDLEKLGKSLEDLAFAIKFVPMDTSPVPAPGP